MARLPIPGQDDGTWGNVLNDYLSQAIDTDGSLKASAVDSAAVIADGIVTEVKLAGAVQTKLNATAPVTSVNSLTGDVTITKSSVGLPDVDNTADANKPISTATQTALNLKSDTTHNHTGTYLPVKGGTSSLTNSTADRFARVDITDDGSATSGWPDRMAFYFAGTRTGYHNEYGELRARPAKSSTVALRAMYFGTGTANIFEVAPSASGTEYFAVSSTAATLSVPLSSTQNISTTGTVTGSNIGAKVTASSSAPSSPAVGDVWVDLSA